MPTNHRDTAFFGHPIGLANAFFTEMWERFSYYGGRALLMIYMISPVAVGGRGMTAGEAGLVIALYQSSNYLMNLPGGWIADRFIGHRAAVLLGGLGIAAGNVLLALPIDALFYPGLAIIAVGTGLLKTNVSTIVGQLYGAKDTRRDSGYTIYYVGINIGAFFAPLACGYFAQSESFRAFLTNHGIDPNWCWHFGFGAAAVGMIAGLIQFTLTQGWLGDAGRERHVPSDPARAAFDRKVLIGIGVAVVAVAGLFVVASLTSAIRVAASTVTDIFGIGLILGSIAVFYGLFQSARDADERKRVIAMISLFIGSIAFFAIFEQASSTLSVFAEKLTRRELLGFDIPATYYQSVNSLFIFFLGPLFAWMWVRLARANREPSSVNKFAIGMIGVALSFVVMLPSLRTVLSGGQVTGGYLIALYFFSTVGELCISPVGLSSMSKLAPARQAGLVMGTWFLGISLGNYLAGRSAAFSEARGFDFLFYVLIGAAVVVAIGLFAIAPTIRRMTETAPAAPADTPAGEPTSLAAARVVKSSD